MTIETIEHWTALEPRATEAPPALLPMICLIDDAVHFARKRCNCRCCSGSSFASVFCAGEPSRHQQIVTYDTSLSRGERGSA